MTAAVRSVISASLLCLAYAQSDNCGASVAPLISGGRPVYRGEFPWLASLYLRDESGNWEQKCGGTLISPSIVLTAAHCVVSCNGTILPADIKVGLGKLSRSFSAKEKDAVIVNVNEIVVPETYVGYVSNFALDIGLLQLTKPLTLDTTIMPACVDWDNSKTVNNGAKVHVAGWGTSDNGTSSEIALGAQMTYLDYNSCVARVRPRYRVYVTNDKICALSVNGSQVDRGDSGGGLTVVKENRYYVIGVVSTKITDQTAFSIFTRVADHGILTWLTNQTSRLDIPGREEYILAADVLRNDIKFPLGLELFKDYLPLILFKGNIDANGLDKITITVTRAKLEKKYILRNVPVNWYKAFQMCLAEGKRLATITSEEENTKMRDTIIHTGLLPSIDIWISLTDMAEEGAPVWMSTGEPVGYTNWYRVRPGQGTPLTYLSADYLSRDFIGSENCTAIIYQSRSDLERIGWTNLHCGVRRLYVCEYFMEV